MCEMDLNLTYSKLSKLVVEQKIDKKRNESIMGKYNTKRNDNSKRQKFGRFEEHSAKKHLKRKPVMTAEERRRMANERERIRVHALSEAFDDLRRVIPCYSNDQRLSKLSILRVAINYIAALDVINAGAKRFGDVVRFKHYVHECTITLQSEYGKSKTQVTAVTKPSCKRKRTSDSRGYFVID